MVLIQVFGKLLLLILMDDDSTISGWLKDIGQYVHFSTPLFVKLLEIIHVSCGRRYQFVAALGQNK